MKYLNKLPKSWVYLTHPLGYDPYDSYASSYMVNTAEFELKKIKGEILEAWTHNQGERNKVATAGVYAPAPAPVAAPFNGDPLL